MIEYKHNKDLSADDLSRVFEASGIKRPYHDLERLQRMIDNSDIIICAWDHDKLIGVARAITDYSYCCYLSDLAVDLDYQKLGIGKQLVELLRERLGEEISLVLLSAPSAVDFYPRIGFDHSDKCFVIARSR